MWFITTLIASIIATSCFYIFKKKYNLGLLSLMLWGATVMILVDHILGYEGGQFFETQTDGLIQNGVWLGIMMLVPVLLIWIMSNIYFKLFNKDN